MTLMMSKTALFSVNPSTPLLWLLTSCTALAQTMIPRAPIGEGAGQSALSDLTTSSLRLNYKAQVLVESGKGNHNDVTHHLRQRHVSMSQLCLASSRSSCGVHPTLPDSCLHGLVPCTAVSVATSFPEG